MCVLLLLLDVDECLDAPCKNGECINKPGHFSCHCQPGFTLDNNVCIGKLVFSNNIDGVNWGQCFFFHYIALFLVRNSTNWLARYQQNKLSPSLCRVVCLCK